jgi:hypothetical protein
MNAHERSDISRIRNSPFGFDRDVVNSLESDHSARLTLAVTANTSLTRTSRFKQEPNSALCFVNPDLNQACGGNIVVLVA